MSDTVLAYFVGISGAVDARHTRCSRSWKFEDRHQELCRDAYKREDPNDYGATTA